MSRAGYGHMVLDSYVDRLRQIRAARRATLDGLRTRRDAEAYQRRMRRAVSQAFGPRPPKTDLNPQILGTIERRAYRIEKVLFESRPGCLVTGHLYVPKGLTGRAPAVLGTCGHSGVGKLEPFYQGFCQRLARSGFVVLIYDPFNQGERDQYWRLKDKSTVASCTHAHNMMGKQLELVGEWFGAWRAWDGVRALDYLLSRPEVDKTRVGLTGNSGGGTMTSWLWAWESRFTMAAPSCFVTTFMANLENEIPADCEQYPPGVIGAGLEMVDLLLASAPKPILLLGQHYCFFDRRGLREAYDDLDRFYKLLGAPEKDRDLFIGPHPHGFSAPNQVAMTEFFCRQAGLKPVPVRQTEALSEEEGSVTAKANTVAAGATPIYELTEARADELAGKRRKLSRTALVRTAGKLLAVKATDPTPHYRVLRSTRLDGVPVARYAVDTQDSVRAIVYKAGAESRYLSTLDVEKEARLYVPHVGSQDELAAEPLVKSLCKKAPLYLVDPRGLGESRPDEAGDFFHPYGMDYMFHGHGLLLGESYLGRRVHDVLSVVALLRDEGATKVRLYGRGQGAVIALFAALLDGKLTSITLKNAPLSYGAMTRQALVAWPVACFPPGVLHHFDLPDCYRALGAKVELIQPWGPDMKPLSGPKLKKALAAEGLRAGLVRRSTR